MPFLLPLFAGGSILVSLLYGTKDLVNDVQSDKQVQGLSTVQLAMIGAAGVGLFLVYKYASKKLHL